MSNTIIPTMACSVIHENSEKLQFVALSCSSHVLVSIAEFLIGHGSHGTVLLRYLKDLTLCKNNFLHKHKVSLIFLAFSFYILYLTHFLHM